MRRIKTLIYRIGLRPKLGSVWHSPSLNWVYGYNDRKPSEVLTTRKP